MAKELPYFKFEPSEWLEGEIQICSDTSIVCFTNLCSGYWLKLGEMTYAFALHKYFRKDANIIQELIDNEILVVNENKINISFLDKQLNEFKEISEKRSKAANKRWENKEENAQAMQLHSTSNAIREEKRREEEKKEYNNTIEQRKLKFAKSLLPFLDQYGKELLREFCDYWTEHGENDKKLRFEKEKSFGLSRRLATWNKNNFKNKGNGKSTITDTEEFNNIVTAIRSTGERR